MWMAKAQKLPVGSQANHDILVQLQCMIDRLETERDAGEDSKAGRTTCHGASGESSARREPGRRGGAGDEHDEVYSNERHKAPAYARSSSVHNDITPPVPLKNPARKYTKRDQRTTTTRFDPSRRLDQLVYDIAKLDRSIHCLEQLIQAQEENPYLNTTQATYGTAALVVEIERLINWKDELGRKIELLMSTPSALGHAQRSMYMEPRQRRRSLQRHVTVTPLTPNVPVDSVNARLRGGGSAQSTVEDKSVNAGGSDAAPPVPRKNPARTRVGTISSSPTDLDREIASLTRDLIRAGQLYVARLRQVSPSAYLANLEATSIRQLVARTQELERQKEQMRSGTPAGRRVSGTETDAGLRGDSSSIQKALNSIPEASRAWFPIDSNIHNPTSGFQRGNTHNHNSSAATPYRILNCQDWKWPHPNWMFDNLSPAEKMSLLRERSHWLNLQKPIDVEDAEIDAEMVRLSSLVGLERDPETWHDPITPGYDRLGNWTGGWVRRQEHRQRAAAQCRLRDGHESYGFNTAKQRTTTISPPSNSGAEWCESDEGERVVGGRD